MPRSFSLLAFALVVCACLGAKNTDDFKKSFDVPKENFVSHGKNTFFNLTPGFAATYEGEEDGEKGKLVITVLDETKQVDGVETRVVEEREWHDGELAEVSRNYFAIDKATNDIYYFGEDSDTYKHGKVSSTEGSWHAGEKGAHYGLFMPAKPEVGQKFYQELAADVAMDRFEVVSLSETAKVPAGEFKNVLKTKETTPLEKGTEYKLYAPEVGLIVDGGLKLTKHGMIEKK
jgi:hypothetical protein